MYNINCDRCQMLLEKAKRLDIQETTYGILNYAKINNCPVDVVKIAETLNCNIIYINPNELPENFECPRNDFAGAIIKNYDKDKSNYIFVNKLDYRTRQRFTIAHELGHLILGHDDIVDCRSKIYSPDEKELEANEFAGNLLIPEEWLYRFIDAVTKSSKELAVIFDVSLQAMEVRREILGK